MESKLVELLVKGNIKQLHEGWFVVAFKVDLRLSAHLLLFAFNNFYLISQKAAAHAVVHLKTLSVVCPSVQTTASPSVRDGILLLKFLSLIIMAATISIIRLLWAEELYSGQAEWSGYLRGSAHWQSPTGRLTLI